MYTVVTQTITYMYTVVTDHHIYIYMYTIVTHRQTDHHMYTVVTHTQTHRHFGMEIQTKK